MKNTSIFLAAILLLSVVATSCKKDNDKDSTFFRFKVNGTDYEATGLLAYATNFSDHFTIYGIKDQSSTETSFISLPLGSPAGVYTLGDSDHSAYYIDASNVTYSTNWGASNGTVTIEEIDASHVKGTFQFTAFDSGTETVKKTITEGAFNVAFR